MNNPSHPGKLWLAGILAGITNTAWAVPIDVGNEDLRVRLDTKVSYSLGVRMQDRKDSLADNAAYDEGDYLFDKHSLINNRLDLLSEFDLVYQKRLGMRVSAAGWYDQTYERDSRSNPDLAGQESYPDGFSSSVSRYYRGPSGEILDAFVFGNFTIGSVPVGLRAGRHAIVYGESLFGSTHAIAYSQAPDDSRKATSNPNASAKELALPVNQISSSVQLADNLQLLAQYTLEWRPSRIPEGGTFFGAADVILDGPDFIAPGIARKNAKDGDNGDVGLALRWRPDSLNSTTFGAYYRRFSEKNAWPVQLQFDADSNLSGRAVYANDIDLYGLSMNRIIGGVALGAELSYRKNGMLVQDGNYIFGPDESLEGPRGNTMHGLLNAIAYFGGNPLWEAASLSTELSWNRLDKVTKNEDLFLSRGYSAACNVQNDEDAGCASREFWAFAVNLAPSWYQVFPGVDLDGQLFYSVNLKGNSPDQGGGNQGFQIYKVGVTAKFDAGTHNVGLAYTGYNTQTNKTTGAPNGPAYDDKGWLSLTYTTSF